MATASDRWSSMIRARAAQKAAISTPLSESRWAAYAPSYRFDPHRKPEPSLAAVLELAQPDDRIVEIGGGAGRIGLPLALRCHSLFNIEPSAAMRDEFYACAAEHGIKNAEAIARTWPANVSGDLIISADVIYFVEEIAAFISAMHQWAQREAVILTWTVPPPNVNAELFRLALGVEEAPAPGIDELLPVLADLGIQPTITELDELFTWPEQLPTDEESALRFALDEVEARDRDAARSRIAPHIADLFDQSTEAWTPRWRAETRAVVLRWFAG